MLPHCDTTCCSHGTLVPRNFVDLGWNSLIASPEIWRLHDWEHLDWWSFASSLVWAVFVAQNSVIDCWDVYWKVRCVSKCMCFACVECRNVKWSAGTTGTQLYSTQFLWYTTHWMLVKRDVHRKACANDLVKEPGSVLGFGFWKFRAQL